MTIKIIKNNVLHFDQISIQISNISRVYTGSRKLKLPISIIIVFIVSLMLLGLQPLIGLIGAVLSGAYLFSIYKHYSNSKQYLVINLNSGQYYSINFKDKDFMEQVRSALEKAFSKNTSATVNIAEQKIINGDHTHNVSHGDNANFNSGIQKMNDINSNNSNSFNTNDNHSSTTIGDINDSTISSSTFGNQNQPQFKGENEIDWALTRRELQSFIAQIKIDSPVKEVSEEALTAARKEDKAAFDNVIKENKTIFRSELFMNTASGVLAQIISRILGIA
ncbi:DUF6232 family protein [Enterococcus malodoratus]|uniref:Uncharacterized protein n=1 Tax=Enterococcus malodoratus ATCC 43197 TaxID=1158601 RepID=R2NPC2_9ENTE|nr:DUF6232 family protein [Enterococcus malodoratus]EOH72843.1 hypothetical protein UAI_03727 [Enterococcus malodoratus ATCC 43197]EOT67391.1 hypothetical protein I585_02912 [Enterococcus malodoratus ATCC 43197]SPX03151.1 Uncharacterised protein [Enterococcus malodoratus]STD69357.1 Uncharacterised protein [Enterococcus malodoratus]